MDSEVQPIIDAFMQTGAKKHSEKIPWIIFKVGKKEKTDAKDSIYILQRGMPGQTYDDLLEILRETDACYVLADYILCPESKKTYPVFINWCKDTAPIKEKLTCSASVSPLKNLLSKSCKVTLECHDFDDICCQEIDKAVKTGYKVADI